MAFNFGHTDSNLFLLAPAAAFYFRGRRRGVFLAWLLWELEVTW